MRKYALVSRVDGTYGQFLFEIEDSERPSLYDTWGEAFEAACDHVLTTLECDMDLTIFVPHPVEVEGGGISLELDGFVIDDLKEFCIRNGQI